MSFSHCRTLHEAQPFCFLTTDDFGTNLQIAVISSQLGVNCTDAISLSEVRSLDEHSGWVPGQILVTSTRYILFISEQIINSYSLNSVFSVSFAPAQGDTIYVF